MKFSDATKIEHAKLRQGYGKYLLQSRFLVIITSPVIWMCVIPIVLADLVGSFFQAVCFPIYGIPKVRRSDYLAFDRHKLTYLNFAEKLNCESVSYTHLSSRTGQRRPTRSTTST